MRVIAYDSAYPDNKATATVTINVNRNPNPPIGPQNYSFNISVSAPIGIEVGVVLSLSRETTRTVLCRDTVKVVFDRFWTSMQPTQTAT